MNGALLNELLVSILSWMLKCGNTTNAIRSQRNCICNRRLDLRWRFAEAGRALRFMAANKYYDDSTILSGGGGEPVFAGLQQNNISQRR